MSILIEDLSVPGDDTSPAFGLRLERFNGRQRMYGIPENDWPMEPPLENRQECDNVNAWRLAHQSRGDGQSQQAMSHRLAKRVAVGRRVINVKGIIVAGETCEEYNIRFGDGPPWAFPFITHNKIIERPS